MFPETQELHSFLRRRRLVDPQVVERSASEVRRVQEQIDGMVEHIKELERQLHMSQEDGERHARARGGEAELAYLQAAEAEALKEAEALAQAAEAEVAKEAPEVREEAPKGKRK